MKPTTRPERYDLLPSLTVIPQELQDTILRVGGKNLYDEPMYRLIPAESHVRIACGVWFIWPADSKPEDRGSTRIQEVLDLLKEGATEEAIEEVLCRPNCTPLRVEYGRRQMREYGDMQGFVLEKWKPATDFGPPEEWNKYQFMGEAQLGPYPQYGLYELVAGPTPHLPTSEDLDIAIRREYRVILAKPHSAKQRAMESINDREAHKDAAFKKMQDDIFAYVKDGPAGLYNRLSLGADRDINDLSKRAGVKGHNHV